MTVSHDEMIAAVRDTISMLDTRLRSSEIYDPRSTPHLAQKLAAMRAVLSVLERHERAMAVVEAARDLIKRRSGALIAMNDAIAAFDAAGDAS